MPQAAKTQLVTGNLNILKRERNPACMQWNNLVSVGRPLPMSLQSPL